MFHFLLLLICAFLSIKLSSSRDFLTTGIDTQTIPVQRVTIENDFYPFNGNVVFEPSTDSIELPLLLYRQLIRHLSSHYSMSCNDNMEHPICSISQEIVELSAILIDGSSDRIALRPEVYIQEKKQVNSTYTLLTLNLKALAEEDAIIMGQHIMGYYHTVLDQNSKADHLYQKFPTILTADGEAGYVIAVFVCSFVCCLIRVACRASRTDRTPIVVQQNLAQPYVPPPQMQQMQPNRIQYSPPRAQNNPNVNVGQYQYAPLREPPVPVAQQNQNMNLSDEERARMQISSHNIEYRENYYGRP